MRASDLGPSVNQASLTVVNRQIFFISFDTLSDISLFNNFLVVSSVLNWRIKTRELGEAKLSSAMSAFFLQLTTLFPTVLAF